MKGLLDRLGGGAWQAKKAPLEGAHPRHGGPADPRGGRTRALRKAPVYWSRHRAYGTRSAPAFPYQETDDQLRAIEADDGGDLTSGAADGPTDLW